MRVAGVSLAAFSLWVYPHSSAVQNISAQIIPASLEQDSSDNSTLTLHNNSTSKFIPLPLNSTYYSSSIVQLATLPSSTLSSNSQPITPSVGPSHHHDDLSPTYDNGDDDAVEENDEDSNNEKHDNCGDTNDDNDSFISKDDDGEDNGNGVITITSSSIYEIDNDE